MVAIEQFRTTIWDYYRTHKRDFLWRSMPQPYYVVVSEIMLQQTQTHRVAPKFERFIHEFPDFSALSKAPLRDLLAAWQGLGYNRRALALQKTAQHIVNDYAGILPDDPELLVELPGIGKATAASICAFAHNKPTVFIETNIRAVFIHFFFAQDRAVSDKELIPLVQEALDHAQPREWYYALMDYGVMLKKNMVNPSRRSKHHTVQSRFEGSDRQIRGMILKLLTTYPVATFEEFSYEIPREPARIEKALNQLVQEGFIKELNGRFFIPVAS